MKKFARKLSLESTQYEDLLHLVRDAIQFGKNGCKFSESDPDESVGMLAQQFCRLQDEERKLTDVL